MMADKPTCNICGAADYTFLFRVRERLRSRKDFFNIIKCKRCGLVYTYPQPSPEDMVQYYPTTYYSPAQFSYPKPLFLPKEKWLNVLRNKLVKIFIEAHYTTLPGTNSGIYDKFIKMVTLPLKVRLGWALPPLRRKGRILDIGCGTGIYLAKLRELGWETYGIEPSEPAARWAKEEIGLNVFCGYLEEADYPADFFDVITLWHVFEHMDRPRTVLRSLRRILKEKGLLIMGLPDVSSIEPKIFGRYWWAWEIPRHRYHFSPQVITRLLKQEGFSHITIEYLPNVHNLILSLQILFLGHFPICDGLIRFFFDPDKNWLLRFLFMPLGYLLGFSKQVGRMVVYSEKESS